ncbi:MAG: 2-oxo acid dehydrogenase subunit E2 [Treponema sp.]|nr:2-oxo acid dehydrogenase subunit E2 [Treponema sp.]
MLKSRRRDGTLLRGLPAFTRIMPYLMPDKAGSIIFYQEDYDVTDCLGFVKDWNRRNSRTEGALLTLFEVVMVAAARAVALRPRINRFIANRRYYQRNQILLSFVAKKELSDDGKEVNVKVPFDPEETLSSAARKVRDYIKKAISEDGLENERVVDSVMRLPSFLLKIINFAYNWLDDHNLLPYSVTESDPMWSTIFLANVGSFGLNPPFHHLFERGTCPIFMAVGKVRDENRLSATPDGSPRVETRKILRVNYSFDDRIADGIYMGRSLELVRRFVEDPAALDRPPEIAPEILAELALRPAGS